ncbi:MAG: glycosyltransferase family 4 protein [Pseudomonadota bacterium]
MRKRVAFYAPMKAPDHPSPSGDRRIARLLMHALDRAGWEVGLASRLRAHQRDGNKVAQDYLFQEAERLADKLADEMAEDPPSVWFTYHCYYKAPDLIGPKVAAKMGIPYVVAEGYRARKRLTGPYARFSEASEAALDQARIIFYLQTRGLDALERDKTEGQRLIHLPPFTALGGEPPEKTAARDGPLKLMTVAMMRPGDKSASYGIMAEALTGLTIDWSLTVIGDGDDRAAVEAAFGPVAERVTFLGQIDDRDAILSHYEAADLFVWPGVNEAFGMVYLEAQAAGLPCIAQDRDGVREVVGPMGRLTDPDDPTAMTRAIEEIASDRAALRAAGREAREHVKAKHGVNAAAELLDRSLTSLF